MILEKDFEDFIELLNNHQVAYMIVGGYALAFHGKPRQTGDLDIWIDISEQNAEKLVTVIKDFGMASLGFSKEDFLKPGYISQIGFPPLRIDILNAIDGITFQEAQKNKLEIELDDNFRVQYIGLNDLVKNKLASGRIQDIADVKEIRKDHKSLLPKRKTNLKRGRHL